MSTRRGTRRWPAILIDAALLFFSLWLAISAWWTVRSFAGVSVSKILYHVLTSLEKAAGIFIVSYVKWAVAVPLVMTILYVLLRTLATHRSVRSRHPSFIRFSDNRFFRYLSLGILLACVVFSVLRLRVPAYIASIVQPSDFVEENYVDPRSVNLVFPDRPRNLIFIFLESMENTYGDETHGGAEPATLIPHLTKLQQDPDTISFSHLAAGSLGGFDDVEGTGWTAGSMIAQSAGVPLLITLRSSLSLSVDELLPGAHAIGDVLEQHGYQQTLLVGSDANFGQREAFFRTHGNYRIFDVKHVSDTYPEFETTGTWGFNDRYLYEFARDELTRMARDEHPFNLTMLTVDTHFPKGDLCPYCKAAFDMQYKNIIVCADEQIADFIAWCETQSWYGNTTIVIVGDHQGMDPEYVSTLPDEFRRTNYNVIINADPQSDGSSLSSEFRTYTAFDMYPTTLAAMGVRIEGDRLALGTNLFSPLPTLAEEYGLARIDDELSRHSPFYTEHIMR
jgi:phosphoglycerol transferase